MQEASRSEAEFKPFNTPYSKSMLTLALQLILLHALNKNQHSSLKQIVLALTYPAHLLFNSFYFQPNNILHLICPINIFSVTALEFQFHPEKIQFKNRHVCLIEPDNINSRITFFFAFYFRYLCRMEFHSAVDIVCWMQQVSWRSHYHIQQYPAGKKYS